MVKRKRGKRGGKQAFLKALKKELNQVGSFDPATAFGEHATPTISLPKPTRCAPLPRKETVVKKRAPHAQDTFVPTRVPTRPMSPHVYARKPPSTSPTKLRVRHDVRTNFKVSRTAVGDFDINQSSQNEDEPTNLTFLYKI